MTRGLKYVPAHAFRTSTGKGFESFRLPQRPKSLLDALLLSPDAELKGVVAQATASGELNRKSLTGVIEQHANFRRVDRAAKIFKLYSRCAQGRANALSAANYTQLISTLASAGQWKRATYVYAAMVSSPGPQPNTACYNAVMGALRVGGHWRGILELIGAMTTKDVPVDSYSITTAMTAVRRAPSASWELPLQLFNLAAVGTAGLPNAHVFGELLRSLHRIAERRAMNMRAWHSALGLFSGLSAASTLTAVETQRLANLTLSVLVVTSVKVGRLGNRAPNGAGTAWRRSLAVYGYLCKHGAADERTYSILSARRVADASYYSTLLQHCLARDIPVPQSLYKALLTTLLIKKQSADVVQFVKHVQQKLLHEPGDTCHSLRRLFGGLADALLAAPDSVAALDIAVQFQEELRLVIPGLTAGLATIGNATDRWVVEGRVAVVSRVSVTTFARLLLYGGYDHILVPYSVVRERVDQLEALDAPRTETAEHKIAFRQLRGLSFVLNTRSRPVSGLGATSTEEVGLMDDADDELHSDDQDILGGVSEDTSAEATKHLLRRRVRILPFMDQLRAHGYLSGPNADAALLKNAPGGGQSSQAGGASDPTASSELSTVTIARSELPASSDSDRRAIAHLAAPTRPGIGLVGLHRGTTGSLSATLMLRALNPDACIHVAALQRHVALYAAYNVPAFDVRAAMTELHAVVKPADDKRQLPQS